MKKKYVVIIAVLFLLTVACQHWVVDSGGIRTEKQEMIHEARQNTTPMP